MLTAKTASKFRSLILVPGVILGANWSLISLPTAAQTAVPPNAQPAPAKSAAQEPEPPAMPEPAPAEHRVTKAEPATTSVSPGAPAAPNSPKPTNPIPAAKPAPAIPSHTTPQSHAVAPAAPAMERGDLEAFFDGVIREQLRAKRIAGAVVAVVVGNQVRFSKGYGYADVATHAKIDPEKTMFRIASISKLFTWTAVMQLVEQGKLDLDTDVNQYLKDFQIPKTFDRPVTLKSLLTHTPGFEDWVIGLFSHKPEDVKPLAEVLREHIPARVRPPLEMVSYSNYGTALAGLIVANAMGTTWESSVEETILKPLGMTHTMLRQPPKEKLPENMSHGYKWEDGRFKDFGFEYIPQAPAGTIATSADDISRFMIAHLNDGEFHGARILKAETARRMREPLYNRDPKTDAMCYGFWESHENGQRVVSHGGDTIVFHSLLALLPAPHVGLFVSYNTNTSGGVREDLFRAFLDRYFPVPDEPRPKPADGFATTGKRYEGEFASTRFSHTTYAKLADLMQGYKVSVNDDGTISIRSASGARRFVEVEPLVFQELDGTRRMVFRADDKGNITHMFPADAAGVAMVRHQWFQRSDFQWGLLIGTSVLFASAVLYWPVIAFCVRGRKSSSIRRTPISGLASVLAWTLSVAALAVMAGIDFTLNDPTEIAFGTPPLLQKLLLAPQVCLALTALCVVFSLVAWIRRYWRLTGRLHYTLVTLAGIAFCWMTYYWNLLQFSYWNPLNFSGKWPWTHT